MNIRLQRGEFCGHKNIDLTPEQRKVHCRECRAVLDPFEVLRGYVVMFDRYRQSAKLAIAEKEKIEARISALKRIEQNLKARIATAKKRAGDKSPLPGNWQLERMGADDNEDDSGAGGA